MTRLDCRKKEWTPEANKKAMVSSRKGDWGGGSRGGERLMEFGVNVGGRPTLRTDFWIECGVNSMTACIQRLIHYLFTGCLLVSV